MSVDPDYHPESLAGRALPLPDGHTLELGEEIQRYPGKRVLLRGRLVGCDVVAKFYIGRLRGAWEWYRGLRGTRALSAAGVPSPALRWSGYVAAAGAWLTAIDYIEPDRAWPPASDTEQAAAHDDLLIALAEHHAAGIIQNDLNWTNFIPRDGRLQSIDGDRVHRRRAPLGRALSLRNLRRLYAYKADFHLDDIRAGYHAYCAHRAWQPDAAELQRLLEQVFRERRQVGERFVRRSLAGWKHFERERIGSWHALRDRRRLGHHDLFAIAPAAGTRPSAEASEHHRKLERGTFRLRPFHRRWDARRAWQRALLCRRLRIPAERPAVLLEDKRVRSHVGGWLITCAHSADTLSTVLPGRTANQQEAIITAIGRLTGLLALAGLRFSPISATQFAVDTEADTVLLRTPEATRVTRRGDTGASGDLTALAALLAADTTIERNAIARALTRGMAAVVPAADEERSA